MSWHALTVDAVLETLRTSREGLSDEQVADRLKQYGPNTLPERGADGVLKILLRQFANPLIVILIFAGGVSAVLGDILDAGIIFGAVAINAIVGFFQEHKVSAVLSRLRRFVRDSAVVMRAGRRQTITADQLVPGDILILRQGDRVSADARVIRGVDLKMSEAVLTGESMPVEKVLNPVAQGTAVADRANMVFRGTLVAEGTGMAVVTATGTATEFGALAQLVVREQGRDRTPLQERFRWLAGVLGVVFVVISAVLFGVGLADDRDPLMMFLTATAVAVAAVPESLPVAVGVVLAIGARRVLERGGLVRRMAAAETLGSVTVIATDKTATLTIGQMRVDHIEPSTGDERHALERLLMLSNAFVENPDASEEQWRMGGSPVEQAILRQGLTLGINPDALAKTHQRFTELPFDSQYKYSAVLVEDDRGQTALLALGAPEVILQASELDEIRRATLTRRAAELAGDGFRVLAFSERIVPSGQRTLTRDDVAQMTFSGLLVLSDPIRPDVLQVIRTAQEAGTRVIMVTGDHLQTARYVAQQTGILRGSDRVLLGSDLGDVSGAVDHYDVFARVSPKDKVRIVEALQAAGHTVAMIGDGVNDAPSLLRADIGVAVGSGTEVAKDASDLVLLKDSFRILIEAIRQGRIIFDNIAKVLVFLLSDAFSEIILVAASIIAGAPLPLLPAQILWVNIIEDILPAVALAADRGEEDVMRQRPRRITDLFSRRFGGMIVFFSIIMNLSLLILFFTFGRDGNIAYARTMVFVALGITSLFYVFSVRSLYRPLWRTRPFSNYWLNGAIGIGIAMYGAAIYIPALRSILGTVPLHLTDWGILISIALLTVGVFEVGKRFLFPKSWKMPHSEN